MIRKVYRLMPVILVGLIIVLTTGDSVAKDVMRPEEIRSKRQVVYDRDTYTKLARLWKEYFGEYPSEYSYANWMYAARYAGDDAYSERLTKGLEMYPANPTLLYLKAIETHGVSNDVEGRKFLEKAIALDPNFIDPWFLLVTHYMSSGDDERLDLALRRLLESGVITDEVMDYNYNMLVSLEKNAILITNGDNDTYPGWILTRIVKVRPDVSIVNRSLLNTEWYPLYLIENGLPRFIDKSNLVNLRDTILHQLKETKGGMPQGGPFGDTLIQTILESAKRAGRPVYVSKTVFHTEKIKAITESGSDLGLVTLVTPSVLSYSEQLSRTYGKWLSDFRTSGLDGWRLQNAPQTDAGRMIISNYASGIVENLSRIRTDVPEIRLRLFHWYLDHIEKSIPNEMRSELAQAWCKNGADIQEIKEWGRAQGLECAGEVER